MIIEIIGQVIVEDIFIEGIIGLFNRLNNLVLRARGLETRSIEEIKYEKLKRRYEHRRVILKTDYQNIRKRTQGTVLELLDSREVIIEFENIEELQKIPLSRILLKIGGEK